MGLLTRMVLGGMQASNPPAHDDFWYGNTPGLATASGMAVSGESAKKLSAWYRGRDILATVLAMLPLLSLLLPLLKMRSLQSQSVPAATRAEVAASVLPATGGAAMAGALPPPIVSVPTL